MEIETMTKSTHVLLCLCAALALVSGCPDSAPEKPVASGSFCHGEEDGTLCDDGSPCTKNDR